MRAANRLALAVTVVGLVASAAITAAPAKATPTDPSNAYVPMSKTGYNPPANPGERRVDVKFAPHKAVQVRGSRLAGAASQTSAGAILNGSAVEQVIPLFANSEQELNTLVATAKTNSGREQTNLNQWVTITVAKDADPAEVVKQLNASPDVEIAYVRPKAVKPPAPDYTPRQGYLRTPEADYGINALHAHSLGATGKGITVADIEFGWETTHEDLTKLRGSDITEGTPVPSFEFHGTGVMGEILADKNSFGVTGIAYDAKALISHVETQERGYSSANAIATAAARLSKGDVLIIELQTNGCSGGGGRGGLVPEEYVPATFDAIRVATSKGIYVVQAAGNGSEDLDSTCYGKPFPDGRGDSGAIIVGAGAGKSNGQSCGTRFGSRQGFSTYGSRVTSFAWGACVTTADVRNSYTDEFSGTSSATPIVTGAVTILAGLIKERGLNVTPQQMRDLVARTGTPSDAGQKIGSMPDLKKAIAELGGSNPQPTNTPKPTDTPRPTNTPKPTATAPAGGEVAVTNGNYREIMARSSQQPVIFVVGANWSGLTKMALPRFRSKLAADRNSWTLAYVDGALYKEARDAFNVLGYPTVIAYSNGEEMTDPARYANGTRSQESVNAFVDTVVSNWKNQH